MATKRSSQALEQVVIDVTPPQETSIAPTPVAPPAPPPPAPPKAKESPVLFPVKLSVNEPHARNRLLDDATPSGASISGISAANSPLAIGSPTSPQDDHNRDHEDEDERKSSCFCRCLQRGTELIVLSGLCIFLLFVDSWTRGPKFWNVTVWRWLSYISFLLATLLIARLVGRFFLSAINAISVISHLNYFLDPMSKPLQFTVAVAFNWGFADVILGRDVYTVTIALSYLFYVGCCFCLRVLLVKLWSVRANRTAFLKRIKRAVKSERLLDALMHESALGPHDKLGFIWDQGARLSGMAHFLAEDHSKEEKPIQADTPLTTPAGSNEVDSLPLSKMAEMMEFMATRQFRRLANLSDTAAEWDEEMSQQMAKEMTNKIFANLGASRRKQLTTEDLSEALSPKMITKALKYYDMDHDGKLSREDLQSGIGRALKERVSLSKALHDQLQIMETLERAVAVGFWILMALSLPVFLGLGLVEMLLAFGTFAVAISFAFGRAIQDFVDACVFVFIIRPYMAGDVVAINNTPEYGGMRVETISLMTSFFVNNEGKGVTIPNSWLSKQVVINNRRSKEVVFRTFLHMAFHTSEQQLALLRQRLEYYIQSSKRFWRGKYTLIPLEISDLNKVTWLLVCKPNVKSWTDGHEWIPIKVHLYKFLAQACQDLKITVTNTPSKMEIISDGGAAVPLPAATGSKQSFSN